jgi:3-dehydroquinate synthase
MVTAPATRLAYGRANLHDDLARRLRALRPRPTKVLVVMDRRAADAVGTRVGRAVADSGMEMVTASPAHGEARKTMESAQRLAARLIRRGADRGSLLLAVGGGATSDLAGFVASILFRGIRWGVVPTTLLAMADAAIGGKTAVNLPEGKNLLGAFHFPEFVVADVRTLQTLPQREWRCGMGEVVKTAMLSGPVLIQQLEATPRAKLGRASEALGQLVRSCARYKTRIVARDPLEGEERKLLNLGHTYGHALETAAGPRRLAHGEAVALGIRCALRDSLERGLCNEAYAARVLELMQRVGLPESYPGSLPATGELRRLLRRDKKAARGELDLVLPIRAGSNIIVHGVPARDVARLIRREFA